jgi:NOL1/NOP2/sun family putative RNA methylase
MMKTKHSYELKPLFVERMKKLLLDKKDFENYLEILKVFPVKSIRCNTLKISPEKLKEKLEQKDWKISQPWKEYPEVIIVESELMPGELGRALEHLLGYYYIQELASMLPILALKPQKEEIILDLCSSPGSKTTQCAAKMENTGTIIANEISLGRIKILASNLERCGVTNTIITKKDGISLCKKLKKEGFQFDKILIDAPCSGEGTLRSSPKTYLMWNIKTVKSLPRTQKQLVSSAIEILKPEGEIIYSTCTHAPEENEEIIDFILKEFKDKIKIEKINLPIKPREGIKKWEDKEYSENIKYCCRIYPQDNNTEGFFITKLRRIK